MVTLTSDVYRTVLMSAPALRASCVASWSRRPSPKLRPCCCGGWLPQCLTNRRASLGRLDSRRKTTPTTRSSSCRVQRESHMATHLHAVSPFAHVPSPMKNFVDQAVKKGASQRAGAEAGAFAEMSSSARTGRWSEAARACTVFLASTRSMASFGWTQIRSSANTGNHAGYVRWA